MVLRRIMRMVHQKRNRTDAPVQIIFAVLRWGYKIFMGSMIAYHILAVSAAVAVWMLADKREKAAQ